MRVACDPECDDGDCRLIGQKLFRGRGCSARVSPAASDGAIAGRRCRQEFHGLGENSIAVATIRLLLPEDGVWFMTEYRSLAELTNNPVGHS